jgi:4a-hydroxytetrahydrobiopterin dehydratase
MDLKRKKCVPCEGGTKPMGKKEATKYLKYATGWKLGKKEISREIKFKDFKSAISFINKLAQIAETEGHHPDIYLHDWNNVKLTLSTHAIKGLSINDFILAAKANAIS